MAILSFLQLEDFVNEIPDAHKVRVEGINRTLPSKSPGDDLAEWYVLVTTRLDTDCIAVFSIRVGRCLAIFVENHSYIVDNAILAEKLIKEHLQAQGFDIGPGTWEPTQVMENLSNGSAGLWHFEDTRLVPNEPLEEAG